MPSLHVHALALQETEAAPGFDSAVFVNGRQRLRPDAACKAWELTTPRTARAISSWFDSSASTGAMDGIRDRETAPFQAQSAETSVSS